MHDALQPTRKRPDLLLEGAFLLTRIARSAPAHALTRLPRSEYDKVLRLLLARVADGENILVADCGAELGISPEIFHELWTLHAVVRAQELGFVLTPIKKGTEH